MIDSILEFFQAFYHSTIGYMIGIWHSLASFLSNAWDIILMLAIVALGFLIFKFLRYLTVPAIILGQIAMLSVVITSMIALVALFAISLVAIYNRIFALSDFISNSSSVGCLGYGVDCLGISGVLGAFFTELFALFIVVLLIRVSGVFLWAMNMINDKIWRIGVLLGSL